MPVISSLIGSNTNNNFFNGAITDSSNMLYHEVLPDAIIVGNQRTNLSPSIETTYSMNDACTEVYVLSNTGSIVVHNLSTGDQYTIAAPEENTNSVKNNGCRIEYANGVIHWLGGWISESRNVLEEEQNIRHYIYSNGAWVKKNNLPKQFSYARTTVFNGKIYYASTGLHDNSYVAYEANNTFRPHVYEYNNANDSWSEVGNLVEEYNTTNNNDIKYLKGVPELFNDGKHLYVSLYPAVEGENCVTYRYDASLNKWIRWGSTDYGVNYISPRSDTKYGVIDNELFIANGSTMHRIIGGHTEIFENCRALQMRVPIRFINDELYAVQNESNNNASVIRIRLTDLILCPKGSTIHTNDNEVCKLNGTTFNEDTYVRVLKKSNIYYTVNIGNKLLYFSNDTVNHQAYCIKGMVINGQKITTTGVTTLNSVDKCVVIE